MSAPRQQHKSVGAPIKAVPSELIPPTNGTVAVLPEDNPTAADFKGALQEKVPELKLAPLSKDTTGVVWLDIAGPPAAQRLEDVLQQYPQIGWVQLPQAGINTFAAVVKKYNKKVWTSAKVSQKCTGATSLSLTSISLSPRNLPFRDPSDNQSPNTHSHSHWLCCAISPNASRRNHGEHQTVSPSLAVA